MKEKLIKYPKVDTPKIKFDSKTGELSIEGKSFPPDVFMEFKDVLEWLEKYIENPASKTLLSLKLDYFNTASSKIIMDILYKMEELYISGNDTLIKWLYPDDDEDMMETGREYAEIVNVPFEHVGYKFIMD